MPNNFNALYAKCYDLLYEDKNYLDEFQYVHNQIATFAKIPMKTILDIGCGTGKTLRLFKDEGYAVAGVDLSDSMLTEAKKYLDQKEDLLCARAAAFKFNKKFEVITSLFHVLSYQTETKELAQVFVNAADHLNKGGLFLFDFWYGPAVLSDLPTKRKKQLENAEIKVLRNTNPVMHYNDNIVDVNFELLIEDRNTGQIQKLEETHRMRYLFLPEIKYLAEKASLTFLGAYKWLTNEPLSEKSWYGFAIVGRDI
jgi:SAM-dependent methyltransferase